MAFELVKRSAESGYVLFDRNQFYCLAIIFSFVSKKVGGLILIKIILGSSYQDQNKNNNIL